ncbi:unnamed protein product [Linum trigynum]|uniref:Uncharacterized protein n=1 Tax=Linum trigynum TaxID=586398 RepID=A0AAV2CGN5_9ROSI
MVYRIGSDNLSSVNKLTEYRKSTKRQKQNDVALFDKSAPAPFAISSPLASAAARQASVSLQSPSSFSLLSISISQFSPRREDEKAYFPDPTLRHPHPP